MSNGAESQPSPNEAPNTPLTDEQETVLKAQMWVWAILPCAIAFASSALFPKVNTFQSIVRFFILWASGFAVLWVAWAGTLSTGLFIKFHRKFGWHRIKAATLNNEVYLGKLISPEKSIKDIRKRTLSIRILVLNFAIVALFFEGYAVLLLCASMLAFDYVNDARIKFIQPSGIYLASSNDSSNATSLSLASMRGFYVASYLDNTTLEHFAPPRAMVNYALYRRTDIGDAWVDYVASMLAYVPIVILDLRNKSPALGIEIEILLELGRNPPNINGKNFIQDQHLILMLSERQDIDDELKQKLGEGRARIDSMSYLECLKFLHAELRFRYLYNDEQIEQFASENA